MTVAVPTINSPVRPPAPAKPPAKRRSRLRQFLMTVLLAVLCGIIGAYWVVTDSARVRSMAEMYLSKLVGGRVQVSKATLSIFDGLRLEGVNVFLDDSNRPDSRIFTARTFLLRVNLQALLSGKLEATQIMALDPHVHLCENLDVPEGPQRWNYRRLVRKTSGAPKSSVLDKPLILPEVLLRSGLIQYSQIKGGQYEVIGSMAIDGQLTPSTQAGGDHYLFDLDSRAPGQPAGPHLRGMIQMGLPGVSAALENFEFNDTIRAMLPAQVQAWWDAHQLAGRIKIPRFFFSRGKPGEPPAFQIELQLEDVSFIITPEDMLGPDHEKDARLWPMPSPLLGGLGDMKVVGQLKGYLPSPKPQPIALRDVDGRFIFTPDKIQLVGVRGKIEENTVNLNGEIQGYSAGAPLKVDVTAKNIMLPANPRYLPSLPRQIRKIYEKLRPAGRASLSLELLRAGIGQRLHASGRVQVLDGAFCFNEFPYPLRHVTGTVAFGPDANTGKDRVDMIGLHGYGIAGTANAESSVAVEGWIAPLDKGSAVKVHVQGEQVTLDEQIRASLPPEARQAIGLFDYLPQPGAEPASTVPVKIHGNFDCMVHRAPGMKKKVYFDVVLDIDHAEGAFVAFPYPLRNVKGQVLVHNTHVDVRNVTARNGDSPLVIDGQVRWGKNKPVEPILAIRAQRVPLDEEFRRALPAEPRRWFERLGLGGMIDIDGHIFLPLGSDSTSDTDFDLAVTLRDGVAQRVGNVHALTHGAADLRVTSQGLTLKSFVAQRGGGAVEGRGTVEWSKTRPRVAINASGFDVPMDSVLYQLIPASGQKAWDEVRPEGSIDFQLAYAGEVHEDERSRAADESFQVTLKPHKLAIKPVLFPYSLRDLSGSVTVTPEKIALEQVSGRHGDSTWTINGSGKDDAKGVWDVSLSGQQIAVDEELKAAVPEGLRTVFETVKLGGKLSFDWPKVRYSTVAGPTADAKDVSLIELQGKVGVSDGVMDVGVPLLAVHGGADLAATLRDGHLEALSGKIHASDLLMQYRPMKDLQCSFRKIKPQGVDVFQFLELQAKLAGGELAGQVDLAVPDKGSAGYGLRMVLRNVDVGQLVGEQDIKGQLTGSLDLQGSWSDVATRHGRGDIKVEGKQLYRVPVVFGLLQVANLSLPVKGPFNEGTTRYSLQGQKVLFEQIELRAPSLLMQGSGILDFGAKRVQMTFSTDNPGLLKIPVLDDFIQGARRELLQIQVTGSVEEPKVQAKSMSTFTTTVDHVFKDQPQTKK